MKVLDLIKHLNETYPDQYEEIAVVIWNKDDVMIRAKALGKTITSEEAIQILCEVEDDLDCNESITWRHIDEKLYHF